MRPSGHPIRSWQPAPFGRADRSGSGKSRQDDRAVWPWSEVRRSGLSRGCHRPAGRREGGQTGGRDACRPAAGQTRTLERPHAPVGRWRAEPDVATAQQSLMIVVVLAAQKDGFHAGRTCGVASRTSGCASSATRGKREPVPVLCLVVAKVRLQGANAAPTDPRTDTITAACRCRLRRTAVPSGSRDASSKPVRSTSCGDCDPVPVRFASLASCHRLAHSPSTCSSSTASHPASCPRCAHYRRAPLFAPGTPAVRPGRRARTLLIDL